MKKIMNYFILLILLLITNSCEDLNQGSYNDAEKYGISSSRENVITAIKKLKIEQPDINPPADSKLEDGYDKDTDGKDITQWYFVHFFNSTDSVVYFTWIKNEASGHSVLGLVSIRKKDKTRWLQVNIDLKGAENDSVKQEFVTRILNPIKEILSKQ